MHRAVKYRIYPDITQEQFLMKTIGCCRKVYNQCLQFKRDTYAVGSISMSTNDLVKVLPSLKRFYPYLKEADSAALQQSVRNLGKAYDSFFKKTSGYPKFKSRKGKLSYTTPRNGNSIRISDNSISLPKTGLIKAVIHRRLNGMICSATVSRNHCNQWFVSVLYEMPDASVSHIIDPGNAVGLDYKSDGLYVSSDGDICGSPKFYRLMEYKLTRAERRLARKTGSHKSEIPSHNFLKQKLRVARIHQKIADQRKDFLHKKSHDLTERYDLIAAEDLDMRALSNRGFGNGKATLDNGYGMFLKMLDYKMSSRGKKLIRIDKWYPSSQLCHNCGTRNPITKDLSVRIVKCSVCGAVYNRDLNASLNIRDEGIRQYLSEINKNLPA